MHADFLFVICGLFRLLFYYWWYVPMAAADALFRRIAPPPTNKRPKADVYISDTTVTARVT